MNSTTNKTFYTCSAESLLLRYKKISKKHVKLGSFLQGSEHIFLGHDACSRKISWTILGNYIMENFQVKHGQCGSIIFPKTCPFESSKVIVRHLPCWQQEFLFLTCPESYPQIYYMTPCFAVLVCKGA